jgi:hypothetical protein
LTDCASLLLNVGHCQVGRLLWSVEGRTRWGVPMPIVNERIMRMRVCNHIPTACLLAIICLVLIAFMSLRLSMPATAETQKDTNACLRTSNALYKRGEELYKKRRWQFPAEFRRVASDLDQYCRDKEFKKADIAIDWLNTCLRNYDKPDNQGYCIRSKKFFCAIDLASEACRTSN